MRFFKIKIVLLPILCCLTTFAYADDDTDGFIPKSQQTFVNDVAPDYGLTPAEAKNALSKAVFQPTIIDKMTKPAEGKAYGDYRKLLITPRRVAEGANFIKQYPFAFNKEARLFGVPRSMISSIIGVETFYGKHTGKFRVLDALATLSFGYPKRADYFQRELAEYLALAKKNKWNIEDLKGSYAGAFGWAQFMPSSYVRFAVSAYPGAAPDLYNPNDAVFSVANYFKKNGWVHGGPVAIRVKASPKVCDQLTCNKRKPLYPVSVWRKHGVSIPNYISGDTQASLITIKMDNGPETWIVFHNFYVITCYNISINYAMAVFELSEAIKKEALKEPPRNGLAALLHPA